MLRRCIAIAALAFASSVTAQTCAPFTDVLASSGFCGNIQWLYNRGVTLGCTANQYCPANPVRRDQMAAFMFRLAHDVVFQDGGNAFGNPAVLGTTDNNALDIRVNNARVMRYEPNPISPNVIGGSPANNVPAGVRGATIAGGGVPVGDTDPSFDSEAPNSVTDAYGTVGGGYSNRAGDAAGTTTDRAWATVGGGLLNTASATVSTVTGGFNNAASGGSSTVAGGQSNTASGFASTVAGGSSNTASGTASFVAGNGATAAHDGTFVWNGWSSGSAISLRHHGFEIYGESGLNINYGSRHPAGHGNSWVFIGKDAGGGFPGQAIATSTGAFLSDSGVWQDSSDVAKKEAFQEIDRQSILDKVVALPVRSWRYKGEDANVRHVGPTAQDFMAAFGFGQDDKTIGGIDAQGVALAAIQGLHAKLEATLLERDATIAAQGRELAAHRAELATLKRAMDLLAGRMAAEPHIAQR